MGKLCQVFCKNLYRENRSQSRSICGQGMLLQSRLKHAPGAFAYLKQQLAGILRAVEQSHCSDLIPTACACPRSVEICRVPQDGKQGVNSNSSCNQHEVPGGVGGLRVKEELSAHSHCHFRVKCTLREGREGRTDSLVLCSRV